MTWHYSFLSYGITTITEYKNKLASKEDNHPLNWDREGYNVEKKGGNFHIRVY